MHEQFDSGLAETLIVLILKEEIPATFKQFHPISLYNVIYKIIIKMLVNRLRPILDDLISSLQSSFISGCSTTNNALVA